jgi:hypothetical protein
VLKPERGYSGIGVKVGGAGRHDADDAIETALTTGLYRSGESRLGLWAEAMPEIDRERGGSFSTIARRTFAA